MKTRLVSTGRVADNVSFNLFSVVTLLGTILLEFSSSLFKLSLVKFVQISSYDAAK